MWGKEIFHDLIDNCTRKSENLKPQESLLVFSSSMFSSEAVPKVIVKISFSRVLRKSVESTSGRFVLVAGHRPSYLQKLNSAISKKLFLGIYSIGCCNQKQPPEVYKKLSLKISLIKLQARDSNTSIFFWILGNF